MADDGPAKSAGPDSRDPSVPSTRRSSQSGTQNAFSGQYGSSSQISDPSRRRPQPSGYGSIITPRQTGESPGTTTPKPKKPGMGRRTTSMHAPHRGQEFSVDDAEDEVDEELLHSRQAKIASGSLRRQPSTLRRRPTAAVPVLAKVDSLSDEDTTQEAHAGAPTDSDSRQASAGGENTPEAEEEVEDANEEDDEDDEDEDLSDAESFTLKDRQEAINETHPFGIRIWKPALYKKSRSVQKTAEGDIHSTPGGYVSNWLLFFNFLWTILFGWWLALLAAVGGLVCLCLGFTDSGCVEYGKILWDLSGYLLYPFGKYVKLLQDEAYAEEDEGEGRSISEYEQWQSGDLEEGRLFFGPTNITGSLIGRRRSSVVSADETQSLLERTGRGSGQVTQSVQMKRRLFGRGKWNLGRVIFFIFFYGLIAPSLFLVSGICWLLVFSIPMGRVTLLLFDHLQRHPLALSFHSDSANTRGPGVPSSSILLCTYRAVGTKYWKYTIDGTNIFLINLLGIVAFVIFDYWVLDVALGLKNALTNSGLVFVLALFSIIPLAYFIGQAVASISAQSSMGVGATINAFFSTIVEVFLYCVALKEGKAQLVEGSIIGSIFAGILFLPGLSMCFGALKRKTQRFNVKSAGVTSTMLLFAVIGAFGPTLFHQIYASHELKCHYCVDMGHENRHRDCRRCYFAQTPAVHDRFYIQAVRPYIWFATVMLFLSYVIGLLFTLRTHAAVIWNEIDEKKMEKMDVSLGGLAGSALINAHQEQGHGVIHGPHAPLTRQNTAGTIGTLPRTDIRDSQLYKRILGQSLKQAGLTPNGVDGGIDKKKPTDGFESQTPHVVPPRSSGGDPTATDDRNPGSMKLESLSEEDNATLVRQVAEMAATAAAVAARDATKAPRKASQLATTPARPPSERAQVPRSGTFGEDHNEAAAHDSAHAGGGHDAPNWSRTKSAVILMVATLAYAVIAEILVNTVDAVLENVDIDEKFLGITLFALVPNTTEFLNAISFAMNGNIALSMEIGSAYALQVCLLQIPALVLFSAVHGRFINPDDVIDHTFTLIFPQWDMITVILCVFLLSYMYGEGKSNYFKGSILILSYLVVVVGFYFSGYTDVDVMGVDPLDTLAIKGELESFRTVGRTTHGRAY